MDSDEINQDEIDNDAANQEMLIDIFYKTKGNIDNIMYTKSMSTLQGPSLPHQNLCPVESVVLIC